MKKEEKEVIYKEIPTNEPSVIEEETVSSKEETSTSKKEKPVKKGPNRILQCFAYFAVALIAVAMILRLIFKDSANIVIYFEGISELLGYFVCIWVGFYFTLKRGNLWWLVGWIVSVVIIVVFYICVLI